MAPPSRDLVARIQSHYSELGLSESGTFIGSKKFKNRLFIQYPNEPRLKIREAVNYLLSVNELIPKHSATPNKPSVTIESSSATLEAWLRGQYPAHCYYKDGTLMGKKKIRAQLVGSIPQHLDAEKVKLDVLIRKISEELDPQKAIVSASGNVGQAEKQHGYAPLEKLVISSKPVPVLGLSPATAVPAAAAFKNLEKPAENPIPRNAKIAAALDSDDERLEQEDIPSLDDQMILLNLVHSSEAPMADNDIKNAVIFSADVLKHCKKTNVLPLYGLIGETVSGNGSGDPRLFLNMNNPFSVFLCGLQGAGKSHSLSCILENCLIPTPIIGTLKRPLSAMVFHFSQYTSRQNFRPCEAAFIACANPHMKIQHKLVAVTVLVSPSNFLGLQESYSQIPGVTVKPLLLRPQDLNISSMLTLMSVEANKSPPLYMSHVTKALREMAAISKDFDYAEFMRRMGEVCMQLMPLQRKPLEQRLELLESFLDLEGNTDAFDFGAGGITIVDLSCPFVDENTACVLFNICLGVYLQDSSIKSGKIVAVDEAHKYITTTRPASKILTESLLQLIRQQRHYGTRIIISTQEPSIDPRLMDLCSVTLIHRFSSPDWFNVLRKHVSVMEDDSKDAELFRQIINLRVGEGLLFAPSALIQADSDLLGDAAETSEEGLGRGFEKLGTRFLKAKIRKRLTADGGKSIVCV